MRCIAPTASRSAPTDRCTSVKARRDASGASSTRANRSDMSRHVFTAAAILALTLTCALHAADRDTITFADARIFPESLTSTKDGAVYFGSLGQDSVYRAAPNASEATVWIKPKTSGLQTVLGVLADERAGVLWVCASAAGGRNGAPVVGETALK